MQYNFFSMLQHTNAIYTDDEYKYNNCQIFDYDYI